MSNEFNEYDGPAATAPTLPGLLLDMAINEQADVELALNVKLPDGGTVTVSARVSILGVTGTEG